MPATILVVDDEQTICSIVAAHFRRLGYNVETALSGPLALQLLAKHKFDVLLTDLQMPEMHGLELLEHVRRDYPLLHSIVLTGHASIDNVLKCLRRGAFSFITKPLDDMCALEECVAMALRSQQLWLEQLTRLRRVYGSSSEARL